MQPYSLALIGITDQAFKAINGELADPTFRMTETFSDPESFIKANREKPFTILVVDEHLLPTLQTVYAQDFKSYLNRTIVATSDRNHWTAGTYEDIIQTIEKPIDIERLLALVLRLLIQNEHLLFQHQARQFLFPGFNSSGQAVQKLALGDQRCVHFVDLNEIISFQACSNYTTAVLKNEQSITTSRTLMHYDRLLQAHGFIRVHRSHLVNGRHVKQLLKPTNTLIMSNGTRIEIAAEKKSKLLSHIGLHS